MDDKYIEQLKRLNQGGKEVITKFKDVLNLFKNEEELENSIAIVKEFEKELPDLQSQIGENEELKEEFFRFADAISKFSISMSHLKTLLGTLQKSLTDIENQD